MASLMGLVVGRLPLGQKGSLTTYLLSSVILAWPFHVVVESPKSAEKKPQGALGSELVPSLPPRSIGQNKSHGYP